MPNNCSKRLGLTVPIESLTSASVVADTIPIEPSTPTSGVAEPDPGYVALDLDMLPLQNSAPGEACRAPWEASTETALDKGVECFADGSTELEFARQISLGELVDFGYEPHAVTIEVPAGSTITIGSSDSTTQGDFDGDGQPDTLQFAWVWGPSGVQLAEGIRVCGTGSAMNPYFVRPSNGNFKARVVPLAGGVAGISIGEPSTNPAVLWFFDEDGYLTPSERPEG